MKSAAKLEMSDATDGLSSQDRCRLLEASPQPTPTTVAAPFIDLSSSESDSEGEMDSDEVERTSKRRKADGKMMACLPPGFLDPLPSAELLIRAPQLPRHQPVAARPALLCSGSRQFWKAGDFDGVPAAEDSVQPSKTSPKIPRLVSSLHPVKSVLTNKLSKDSGEFQGKYISRVSKEGKSISSTESSKGVRSSPMENGSKNIKEKPLQSTGSSCLGSHSMPSGSTESDPESQTKGEDVFSSIPNASALSKFSDKETSCLELQETFPNQQISGGTRSLTKEPIVMPLETIPDPEVYQLRISLLEDENEALKQRIKSMDETILLEKRKNKSLIDKVEDTEKKLEELNKEQEALIDIFAEERNRRDEEEANLRKRLKEAQDEMHDLLKKLASNKCNSSSLS